MGGCGILFERLAAATTCVWRFDTLSEKAKVIMIIHWRVTRVRDGALVSWRLDCDVTQVYSCNEGSYK